MISRWRRGCSSAAAVTGPAGNSVVGSPRDGSGAGAAGGRGCAGATTGTGMGAGRLVAGSSGAAGPWSEEGAARPGARLGAQVGARAGAGDGVATPFDCNRADGASACRARCCAAAWRATGTTGVVAATSPASPVRAARSGAACGDGCAAAVFESGLSGTRSGAEAGAAPAAAALDCNRPTGSSAPAVDGRPATAAGSFDDGLPRSLPVRRPSRPPRPPPASRGDRASRPAATRPCAADPVIAAAPASPAPAPDSSAARLHAALGEAGSPGRSWQLSRPAFGIARRHARSAAANAVSICAVAVTLNSPLRSIARTQP